MLQTSTTTNGQLGLDAVRHYTHALNDLNKSLSNYKGLGGRPSEDVLLTIVFLCKYEIVNGSTKMWKQHLVGLERLVNMWQSKFQDASEAGAFVQGFITYHSNIAKITDLAADEMGHMSDISHIGQPAKDKNSPRALDPYIGFTEYLLKAFASISLISRRIVSAKSCTVQIHEDIKTLEKKLASWKWSLKSYVVPDGVSPSDLQMLERVAEAYRFAAYIYLHSTLKTVNSDQPSRSGAYGDLLRAKDFGLPYSVEYAVQQCLDLAGEIPSGHGCESALLLPLFLAGCETNNVTHISVVVQRLIKMEQTIGIGNIKRAREVVQK
ncbi:hypothetical protein BP5796_07647 [Coleophoma crateriformis]|uniref:Uncharacterized protein n=1 Tax=Coleophoma crateriformis TaxID=565419 RepID=A0A3D8RJI2_9HELO|nr:hypothetical protein BP5796_07647 [Coleophoma crateriformis]